LDDSKESLYLKTCSSEESLENKPRTTKTNNFLTTNKSTSDKIKILNSTGSTAHRFPSKNSNSRPIEHEHEIMLTEPTVRIDSSKLRNSSSKNKITPISLNKANGKPIINFSGLLSKPSSSQSKPPSSTISKNGSSSLLKTAMTTKGSEKKFTFEKPGSAMLHKDMNRLNTNIRMKLDNLVMTNNKKKC